MIDDAKAGGSSGPGVSPGRIESNRRDARATTIFCLGDSHVSFFSGADAIQPEWPAHSTDTLPWFRTFHLGPVLAYNLVRENTTSRGREKFFEVLRAVVPPKSRVLLCFGEIDCRAHLLLQAQRQKKSPAEIAVACVERYAQFIGEVTAAGFEVIIYNAIPSHRGRPGPGKKPGEFATVGSSRARNEATRLFNRELKSMCARSGWRFLKNFDCFVFPNGLTDSWYCMDRIHLAQRAMPATLNRLRELLPDLGIPPQTLPTPPTAWQRWKMFVSGRRQRIGKELGKVARLCGGK